MQAIVMYFSKFEPYLHRCLVRPLFNILEISECPKYFMSSSDTSLLKISQWDLTAPQATHMNKMDVYLQAVPIKPYHRKVHLLRV